MLENKITLGSLCDPQVCTPRLDLNCYTESFRQLLYAQSMLPKVPDLLALPSSAGEHFETRRCKREQSR